MTNEKPKSVAQKRTRRGRKSKEELVLNLDADESKQLELWEDTNKQLPAIKDDMSTMQFPFFSISNKVDTRIRSFSRDGNILRIYPSAVGCPTQSDKDVLIFLASILARANFKNRQDYLVKRRIRVRVSDFAKVTRRSRGNLTPKLLLNSLRRLSGVRLETNIRNDMSSESHGFSYIDEYKIVESNKSQDGIIECEVVLSEWFAQHIVDLNLLTLNDDYFSLSPTEKRVYELVRKFCGTQRLWKIKLSVLADYMGVDTEHGLRYFRRSIRKIVKEGNIPDYVLYFDPKLDQLVSFKGPFEDVYSWVLQDTERWEWYNTLEHKEFKETDPIDVIAKEKKDAVEESSLKSENKK